MLAYASPASPFPDGAKYSKDLDSFNKLLPPPIEFVEGSSSGALAVPEGKYDPINATPKASKADAVRPSSIAARPSTPTTPKPTAASTPRANGKAPSLYPGIIDLTWPPNVSSSGSGLYNSGNTCFLNSALQCLLHTPPLLRLLYEHAHGRCPVKDNVFCMTCSLGKVASQAYSNRNAFMPQAVSGKLQTIAKHMRRGRQEDSHEFLRYAIDALQKSCLAGQPPKLDPKLAETTWVHKLFGGRLRSRVKCTECGHNSDTFDSILDLSVDILNTNSVKLALRKFVAVEYLKGQDKYKCEKCKKPVVAEKSFTIHEAPAVLTMHLKRFTPMGRKLTHFIDYEERLALKPYMSDGSFGPSYSLYGVICHAGGGPNSGHYFSYVKDCRGQWHEMNDESVTKVPHAPLKQKNAYILFYLRDRGQGLDAAVNLPPSSMVPRQSIAKNMKKRKASEDGHEDEGVKVTKPFIGPRMPSPDRISTPKKTAEKPNATPAKADPQAERVRQKIEAAQTSKALDGLEAYGSDSSDKEDDGPEELVNSKTVVGLQPPPTVTSPLPPSSPLPTSAATPSRSSTADSNAANSVRTPISTTNFYGGPSSSHKRKHSESFGKERRSSAASFNPFDKSRLTSGRKKPRPL